MSARHVWAFALGWFVTSFATRLHGQPETHTLSVNEGRPLAAAALHLEEEFFLPVSYEDLQIKEAGQMREVSAEVQNAAQKALNPQAQIWVPKGGALTLAFSVDRATKKLTDPAGTLQALVARYNALGSHQFQVDARNGRFLIRPAGQGGSVLDTRVSLPLGSRNVADTLQLVLDQVGRQIGLRMWLGAFPIRLFATTEIMESAISEPAGDVIARILAKVSPDRPMSYQLLFDPGLQLYGLSTHVVAAPTPVVDSASQTVIQPPGNTAGPRTPSPWFRKN